MAVYDSPQSVHMPQAISSDKKAKTQQPKKKSAGTKKTTSKSATKDKRRGR